MDAEEMHFPPNSFDAIIAGDIIEHLRDPRGFLLTCHKMLRPDGKIIITTPNRNDLGNLIRKIFRREKRFPIVWYYPDGVQDAHYFELTKRELKGLLSETGFKMIKLRQFYLGIAETKYALKLFAPLSQMLFAVGIKS
jgi:2-polyprenyl-3-methyl-5-hydroxy-6-metoxy-1,4-benzoquinol methylase